MNKTRFTKTKIVSIQKQADGGLKVKDLCREHRISEATYYNRKSKYGGMSASVLKQTKELEAENAKLKRMYADLALENRSMNDLIEKSSESAGEAGGVLPVASAPANAGCISHSRLEQTGRCASALELPEVRRPLPDPGSPLESQADLPCVLRPRVESVAADQTSAAGSGNGCHSVVPQRPNQVWSADFMSDALYYKHALLGIYFDR